MQTDKRHNRQRVHVRALARLQQLHEEIGAGHCPSVRDLAEHVERHPRTIWRDLKALKDDFNAPLTYDSQRKGYKYTAPGWDLPSRRFSEGNQMRGGRLTIVSLVFDAYQARRLHKRPAFHVDEEREQLPNGDLRLSFSMGLNGLEDVALLCLTYSSHCRVEEPAALRQLVRERLQQALIHHQEQ
jgi:predicted DNA-binding transcriptional regulator YafY